MSVAYIQGDSQYGSTVTFFIGGTKEQIIDKIVEKAYDESQFDGEDFTRFPGYEHVTNWEDEGYKNFLKKLLNEDMTCLNSISTKPDENYFYISVQDEDKWYNHFKYITGGKEGIKISYHNFKTGEEDEL